MNDRTQMLLERSVAARAFLWLLAACLRQTHGDEGGLAVIDCLDRGVAAFRIPIIASKWGMSEAEQQDLFQMARVVRAMWYEDAEGELW